MNIRANEHMFTNELALIKESMEYRYATQVVIEGVCGVRPQVTFDVICNSPYVLYGNTR